MTDPLVSKPVRDEALGMLSVSGTLAGLCVTIVAFIHTMDRGGSTFVDDLLACCAGGFLLCIYLLFWVLKTRHAGRAILLLKIVDVLFLAALSGMTVAGFFMVYTIW